MAQRLMLQVAAWSGAMALVVVLFVVVLIAMRVGARHLLRRLCTRTEGAVTIEFAIIVPVLLLLMVGGMDLGHMYYMQHVITTASREGARYAAKYTVSPNDPTSSDISDYVKSSSGLNYNSFNLNDLVVSGSYTGVSPNKIVTVTVQADKHWWIIGSLPGMTDPKTLTATTAMSVERP